MTRLVENVDDDLWRQLVGVAKIRDMKVGELLNELIFTFLEKHKIRNLKNDKSAKARRSL